MHAFAFENCCSPPVLQLTVGQYIHQLPRLYLHCQSVISLQLPLYPDLTISEETLPTNGVVNIGNFVKIKVVLTNLGEGTARGATLNQTLQAGLQYGDLPEGEHRKKSTFNP